MQWLGPEPDNFAGDLLQSLEAAQARRRAEGHEFTAIPQEDSELQEVLTALEERARCLTASRLAATLCELSMAVFELRAWYTTGLGHLVLLLLELVISSPQRLPFTPSATVTPEQATLRLLEGLVLVHTVRHASERTVHVLEGLLTRRRLPPGTAIRLEAALIRLMEATGSAQLDPPARVPLCEDSGEAFLQELAQSLRPDTEYLERAERAKESLKQAVELVFPGSTPEYFGSAVNGFCLQTSDLDCVVQLQGRSIPIPSGEAGQWQERAQATEAVRTLGQALQSNAELGLKVVEAVTKARVPLLKCESSEGVAIDISFNNTLPLHNSRMLHDFSQLDERVQQLGCLVKWWARCRGVSDAFEGTLSPYAHMLLVIHWLQHIGLVPMLEEDVGSRGSPALHSWGQQRRYRYARCAPPSPELQCATLHGLLAGFFRYFAYEFPAHSEVVTLWARADLVFKAEFFQSLASCALDSAAPEAAEETAENQAEDDEPHLPVAADAGASLALAVRPPQAQPFLAGPAVADALLRKGSLTLHAADQDVQKLFYTRQLLCIADPLEQARTLGTKSLGFERLVFEQRRAFHLLTASGEQLSELFAGDPPRTVQKLLAAARTDLPALRGLQDASYLTVTIQVPNGDIGRIMGMKGAKIKELQRTAGIRSVHIGASGDKLTAPLVIRGFPEAVRRCAERVRDQLASAASLRRPLQPSPLQDALQRAPLPHLPVGSDGESGSGSEAPEPVAEPLPDWAPSVSGSRLQQEAPLEGGLLQEKASLKGRVLRTLKKSHLFRRDELFDILECLDDMDVRALSREGQREVWFRLDEEGDVWELAQLQPLEERVLAQRLRPGSWLHGAGEDAGHGSEPADRRWRSRHAKISDQPSESGSGGHRVWKPSARHQAGAEPASARSRRAVGGGPDDGAGGPGPPATALTGFDQGASGRLWRTVSPERLQEPSRASRTRRWPARPTAAGATAGAGGEETEGGALASDVGDEGEASPRDTRRIKNRTAKMSAADVEPFLQRRLVALTQTSMWSKGEAVRITGGTETCWKVQSLDGTRNFTLRKDNQDVVWSWA